MNNFPQAVLNESNERFGLLSVSTWVGRDNTQFWGEIQITIPEAIGFLRFHIVLHTNICKFCRASFHKRCFLRWVPQNLDTRSRNCN